MTSQLQRLVLEFKPEELVVRALYRRSPQGSANPGTVKRRREVAELVRTGLEDALAALEGDVGASLVGTSGFTQREDIMVANRKESAA